MALVEVVDVLQTPLESERLLAGHLDAPMAGDVAEVPELEVDGWVIARHARVAAVEVALGDAVLRRIPVAVVRGDVGRDYPGVPEACHSGYRGAVPLGRAPDEFELDVQAVLADGARVPLATIVGRHRIWSPPPSLGLVSEMKAAPAAPKRAPEPNAARSLSSRRCRVTVIIPVFNLAALTRQCLNTVLAERHELAAVDVIVVDDASTDLTPRLLSEYGDLVRVVTHPVNIGFAAGCNGAAAIATGDYLVFLNNDTTPQPGWLDALVRYAESHPGAAVVGSKLLFPDDTVQHCGVVIGLDRYPRHLYKGFPGDHPAVNTSRRFQIVTAGCALFRRDVFRAAGGFDTAYVAGWEDVDLCLRLGEQGHEVHYCHESVLYHLESASRDIDSAEERANRRLYGRRWFGVVQPDDVRYYVEDDLLSVTYVDSYPFHLTASPLLAVLDGHERDRQTDRQLAVCSWQVQNLRRDYIELSVRLQEADVRESLVADPAVGGVPGIHTPAAVERRSWRRGSASASAISSQEPSARRGPSMPPTKAEVAPLDALRRRILRRRTGADS